MGNKSMCKISGGYMFCQNSESFDFSATGDGTWLHPFDNKLLERALCMNRSNYLGVPITMMGILLYIQLLSYYIQLLWYYRGSGCSWTWKGQQTKGWRSGRNVLLGDWQTIWPQVGGVFLLQGDTFAVTQDCAGEHQWSDPATGFTLRWKLYKTRSGKWWG